MIRRIPKLLTSAAPVVLIGALLYAGIFIKPSPHGAEVANPAFERGDQFYGISVSTSGASRTILLAGAHGKLLRSTDDGKTWTLSNAHIDGVLQDVGSWSDGRSIAVGDRGAVLVSGAGARDWHQVNVPLSGISNKLLRVRLLPDGEAWAVGEGGVMLHTSDYGGTWTNRGTLEDIAWNDVALYGKHGVAIGEFGRITLTDDGGKTWHSVPSPVKSSLMAVAFRDSSNVIAVGLSGTILSSADGGEHWTQLPVATREHLFDVVWSGADWIATGDKGVVARGDPAGDLWRISRVSDRSRGWYVRVAVSRQNCYFVGSAFAAVPNCAG